jgi:ABC-type branched-subunit amino acid transport system ATPase component
MMHARNISKSFGGIHAVQNVSFDCDEGTVVGLIGPNGSGKSTLINVLTKMLVPDSGTVSIKGGFGRTFQDVRVWEHMTVLDNVLLVTQAHGLVASLLEFRTHDSKAHIAIERVGLSKRVDTYASYLSYGQRKLLEIARVLATDAQNLFFDEPFAGLFPEMIEQVKKIILDEKKRGASIILIEHDMSVIRELCDSVVVLHAGEKIAEGTVLEVLSSIEVIEAYLGK